MIKYLTFDSKKFLKDYYEKKCSLPKELQRKIINKLTQKEKEAIEVHFFTRKAEPICEKYNIGIKRLAEIRYAGENRIRAYVDENVIMDNISNYYDFNIKSFLKDATEDDACNRIYGEASSILSELEQDVIYESYFEKKKLRQIAMHLCYSEQYMHRVKKSAEAKLKGFFIGKYIPISVDYTVTKNTNLSRIK